MTAIAMAGLAVNLHASPRDPDAYELWNNCSEMPDIFEFLPTYLPNEPIDFVDLDQRVMAERAQWHALQYTRDKDFGTVQVNTGRWYGGMGADRWPLGTVDPVRQLEAFRVTAWEIDGTRHPVDPSCVLAMSTDDQNFALYNIWVRFNETGIHTLRIFGRQQSDFFFLYPFRAFGAADPLGLLGRRVFLRGEKIGDLLDDEFVHSYELHVNRDGSGYSGQ
jgi:hypothetical protein